MRRGHVHYEGFHDGAWGYLEEDIFDARERRLAAEAAKPKEQPAAADQENDAQPVYADSAEASGLVEVEAEEELQAVAAAVRQVAPEQRGAFHQKLRSALSRIVKRLKGEQPQG